MGFCLTFGGDFTTRKGDHENAESQYCETIEPTVSIAVHLSETGTEDSCFHRDAG
jgi:hypothetical protein